ncbi:MAG: hypothetical protein HC880_11915 [Bacteroidia bacterium]|nr:hypothetical protein [Bacteroidia bacterium]
MSVLMETYAQAQFNLSGQVAIPLDDFSDNTDAIGGGGRASLLFPVAPRVPIFLGVEFSYLNYGANSQRVNEDIEIVAVGQVIDRIPINLRIQTNNNMVNGFTVIRVKAPLPIVQPYLDGLVGFNYLYTRTRVLEEGNQRYLTDPEENNVVNARTQLSSFVFSYGGGWGYYV